MRSPRASTACRPTGQAFARQALGGQSSVEYAVVLAAFLALIVGLAALWHLFGDGVVVQHALASASHHVGGALDGWVDVFLY